MIVLVFTTATMITSSSFRSVIVPIFLLLKLSSAAAAVDASHDATANVSTSTAREQQQQRQQEECANQLTTFLTCLSTSGAAGGGIFNNVFQEVCQDCIAAGYGTVDVSLLSCDELVGVVGGALDRCAPKCALDGCTTEVRNLLTCFSISSSDCAKHTSTPSSSPSANDNSFTGEGNAVGAFAAFLAVIRQIIALLINIFGSS